MQADIAATDDNDLAGCLLPVAERTNDGIDLFASGQYIDIVSSGELVIGIGDETSPIAHHGQNSHARFVIVFGNLDETATDDGAVGAAVDAKQFDKAASHRNAVECAGGPEAAGDAVRNLDLGRDDDIDRKMLGSIKAALVLREIARVA